TLPVTFVGAADAVAPFATGATHPTALASGDVNHDGVDDLLVGYSLPRGGAIAVYRGNLDAFAPQTQQSFRAIGDGRFPLTFLPDVHIFRVAFKPDLLAVTTFSGQPYPGVVAATRGGHVLSLFRGDGTGRFEQAQAIAVPGAITALTAGALGNG